MRFTIQREVFLKPLNQVVGVVERRQTLAVLSNLLVHVEKGVVGLTGSDQEVEMYAQAVAEDTESGDITVPARKLFDIVRALPDGSQIQFDQSGDRVTLRAARSRFTLSTLPASEFPTVEDIAPLERVSLGESALKELIDRTSFAMAHQDVRYYLNGLLLELRDRVLRCVATDGHRLAMCETAVPLAVKGERQLILPRKGVLELQRLLDSGEGVVELEFGKNHVRARCSSFVFTSKLIDGRFPDYEAVVPIGADRTVLMSRDVLRASLGRVGILSNEKYRGVKLEVSPNRLRIVAHNPEQEEATEEIEAETSVDGLAVGFNVNYLLDALGALRGLQVLLCLRDGNSSCLIRDADDAHAQHVVMPLRL
ncbi:MAG: DNA polymerase III subunit beta [Lysobacterales bacterium]